MQTQILAELRRFLNALHWIPEHYQLLPVNQESTNQQSTNLAFELRVTASRETLGQTQSYLVKYLGKTDFMPFDRQCTLALQSRLAELSLAPQPLVLSDDQHYLVEQWVPRCPTMSRSALIDKLGVLMADLHQIDVAQANIDASALALLSHWQGYWQQLTAGSDDLWRKRAIFEHQIEALTPIWRDTELNCLCHHDLSLQHIASLENNVIYDWEYGAIGCRFFDLAHAIQVNQLTMAEQCQLLQRYMLHLHEIHRQTQLTLDTLVCSVNRMMPLATLTNELWWAAYQVHSSPRV